MNGIVLFSVGILLAAAGVMDYIKKDSKKNSEPSKEVVEPPKKEEKGE